MSIFEFIALICLLALSLIASVRNQNVTFFVATTELIDYTNMTTSEVNTFLGYCSAQELPELTLRLRAMYDWDDEEPAANEVAKAKTIITTANSLGITINLDMHTWHTTWDQYFDDSAGSVATVAANRAKYINYVEAAIDAFDGYEVKAWMVLNEPQYQYATSGENQFIKDILTAAAAKTNQPISVRFMAGASPWEAQHHYSTTISAQCDFYCINAYWDPRYPTQEVNNSGEQDILDTLSASNTAGKEMWVTEFGARKSNLTNQKNYVAAWVDYAETKEIERIYCWVSQPEGGASENYNIWTGYTPNPAFYELVSSEEQGPDHHIKDFTVGGWLLDKNYTTFTLGGHLTSGAAQPMAQFTMGGHLQASYQTTFTLGGYLQLSDYDPPAPASGSNLFNTILDRVKKTSTPHRMMVGGRKAAVGGEKLRVGVCIPTFDTIMAEMKKKGS